MTQTVDGSKVIEALRHQRNEAHDTIALLQVQLADAQQALTVAQQPKEPTVEQTATDGQ